MNYRDLLHLETQYAALEKLQMKCARSLACGDACLKVTEVSASAEPVLRYRAKTIKKFDDDLNTIQSDMTVRRLRWLQCMVKTLESSATTLAVLHGRFF